jgi:hypothetical protein
VEYLDVVRWLAAAALLHDGVHQPMPLHRLDELEGQREALLAPSQNGNQEGDEPVYRGIGRRLLCRWKSRLTSCAGGHSG